MATPPPRDNRLNKDDLAFYWINAQPAVAAYIATMIIDFNDVEEVLQCVAAAAIQKFDDYDPQRPFVTWAIGIARYEVLNFRRRRLNDRHIFSDQAQERIERAHVAIQPEIDNYRSALVHCMDLLAAQARKLVELRYLQNLKTGKIAARLGMTPAAVSASLYRIRKGLRDCVTSKLAVEGRRHD